MRKFLTVLITWLMVLVALAQGGPGGPGGPGGGGTPTISLQLDLNDWMTNEPATNKDYFPNELPAVEGVTHTVVYDKGGSAQVQLYFKNDNPQEAFVGQLIVEDARYIHDTAPLPVPLGSPPPVTIPDTILSAPTVSLNIGIGQTAPATLTISGLPNFVTKGYIKLQLKAEGNFGAQPVGGGNPSPFNGIFSSQPILITFLPPTGAMEPVWTELAEMSCTMAQGEYTLPDLSRELTRGLFFGNIFRYNLPSGYSSYIYELGGYTHGFELSLFLEQLGYYNGPVLGGCMTMNTFLGLLHHSQGVPAVGRIVECENGSPFITNKIVPIGTDASQESYYIRVVFDWHFQLLSNGLVFDSALAYRYDIQGQSFMSPAYLWDYSGSWQTMINSAIFGLAYRNFPAAEDLPEDHSAYDFKPYKAGSTPGQLVDEFYQVWDILEVR